MFGGYYYPKWVHERQILAQDSTKIVQVNSQSGSHPGSSRLMGSTVPWWLLITREFTKISWNNHKVQNIIIKEEGDTYHVNQAYYQTLEKDEKTHMRAAVGALSPTAVVLNFNWNLFSESYKK